jgi:hypothetical protein
MTHKVAGLTHIPAELVLHITSYIPVKKYHSLIRVCKTWSILFSQLLKNHQEKVFKSFGKKEWKCSKLTTIATRDAIPVAEDNYDHDYFSCYRENCVVHQSKVTFTLERADKAMSEEEFETYTSENDVYIGVEFNEFECSLPFFIIKESERIEEPRSKWKSEYIVKTKIVNNIAKKEWKELKSLILSIRAIRVSDGSNIDDVSLYMNGYTYIYCVRTRGNAVWTMKIVFAESIVGAFYVDMADRIDYFHGNEPGC